MAENEPPYDRKIAEREDALVREGVSTAAQLLGAQTVEEAETIREKGKQPNTTTPQTS